jgi:hydroxypyruvate isomerase
MPRFAANLAYLFTERPLPERIGAAKAAGFGAVEFQMPYDHPPGVLKAEIERHGVAVLGLNTALGRPGEAGLAAVRGPQAFTPPFADRGRRGRVSRRREGGAIASGQAFY